MADLSFPFRPSPSCYSLALQLLHGWLLAMAADAAAGKALFATKCVACHGGTGEGKDSIAKALKVEMKPFASKDVQAKTDAALKKDSTEGMGKMKGVKLSDDEAANVIAFVRTLAK